MICSPVSQDDSFFMVTVDRMIHSPVGQDDSFSMATMEHDDSFSCGLG